MSARFMPVIKGDELFTPNGVLIQTLTNVPRDGTILMYDSKSKDGYVPYTPAQLVELAGGSTIIPTILTTKGDIVVRDSATAVRFPVGPDGYVLQADSSTPSGLSWSSPSATSGDENPTVGTMAKRNGAMSARPGALQAVGFIASGNIIPSIDQTQTIGESGQKFANIYSLAGTINTLTAPTKVITPIVESTGSITISSPTSSIILAQGGSTALSIDATYVRSMTRVFAADNGIVIGVPSLNSIAFKLVVDSSGPGAPVLAIQRWTGFSWVNAGLIA